MVSTGASSGLDLETVGDWTSLGSERCAWETLDWTSCSARSTLREMSNVTVMRQEPDRACDWICWMPSTWESDCSSGSQISRSMAGGDAPGQLTETLMLG